MNSNENSTTAAGGAMTRRAFVRGIPLIGGSMALPALAGPALTPDERIEAATAEIVAAMAEKYPTWRQAQVKNDAIPAVNGRGHYIRLARHAVLVYASEERFGPEEGMWWVRDAQ